MSDTTNRTPNRLAGETSPYLLQHAHNPVDWYPWGEEAFEKAKREDKPVFLSIGYSACHWCHVMERESFEDEATADLLNRDWVSIKVDREERPDIDSIYMTAVQMMTGHGGWPMSMFLTPDGEPFYGGTYFPPHDRHGLPSFRKVISHLAHMYRDERDTLVGTAAELRGALKRATDVTGASQSLGHKELDAAALRVASAFDPVNGGFGSAPKFPPSMTLDFLMQACHRDGDDQLRDVILVTLSKMAGGGMYDQIGGGFHRYSVDARWLVPHFEKMLYDNALLARLYVRAWQWTRDDLYRRIAEETLGFVAREMTSPDGGFYSTLDADSEGEEGKFYVWSREEVLEVLGDEEGRLFCALYDITERGNWEGRNIPNLPRDLADVAADLGVTAETLADVAARGKCALYGVRGERVWPGRDEKILAGWNGWMLAAFAEAAMAFGSEEHHEIVRRNARFLTTKMIRDGRLYRNFKDGRLSIPALLEDCAGVAWGLLAAFEATGEGEWLAASRRLADDILERFLDSENGGFFDTPIDHEKLITRPRDLFDNATPSGNSVATHVLLRLAVLFGERRYATEAERTLESIAPLAVRHPQGFGFLLSAGEFASAELREIVVTGGSNDEGRRNLLRVVGEAYLPQSVVVQGPVEGSPLLEGRDPGVTRAYVCRGYVCDSPTDDPDALQAMLT
jgi:uncharacterized protein YyaL (SSP411 family)